MKLDTFPRIFNQVKSSHQYVYIKHFDLAMVDVVSTRVCASLSSLGAQQIGLSHFRLVLNFGGEGILCRACRQAVSVTYAHACHMHTL